MLPSSVDYFPWVYIFIILPEGPKVCCSCDIGCYHSSVDENSSLTCCLAESTAKYLQTFGRSVLSPSSGSNSVLESTLKIKARRLSETSVAIYQSTRRNIPEDLNRHEVSHCAVSVSSLSDVQYTKAVPLCARQCLTCGWSTVGRILVPVHSLVRLSWAAGWWSGSIGP